MDTELTPLSFGPAETDYHDKARLFVVRSIQPPLGTMLREKLLQFYAEDQTSPVTLLINSEGGDVYEAIEICDVVETMRSWGLPIFGQVSGSCCSAALSVLQCCERRLMTESSILMIHGTQYHVDGLADAKLFKANMRLHDIIMDAEMRRFDRCKLPKRKLREIFDCLVPTYLSAQEALDWGLVDEVLTTCPA